MNNLNENETGSNGGKKYMSEFYLFRAGKLAQWFLGAVNFLASLSEEQRNNTIYSRRYKATVNEDPNSRGLSQYSGGSNDSELTR